MLSPGMHTGRLAAQTLDCCVPLETVRLTSPQRGLLMGGRSSLRLPPPPLTSPPQPSSGSFTGHSTHHEPLCLAAFLQSCAQSIPVSYKLDMPRIVDWSWWTDLFHATLLCVLCAVYHIHSKPMFGINCYQVSWCTDDGVITGQRSPNELQSRDYICCPDNFFVCLCGCFYWKFVK